MRLFSPAAVMMTAILALALALRIGAGVWWQERLPPGVKFGFGDSEGYWVLARAIARGQPYEYNGAKIFRTPGYPLLLAPLFLVRDAPPVFWARLLSAVLSTVAVGVVGWLAWLLFDQRTALIAALVAAVYPEAIAGGAFVLSEAPFTPLMMLQLVFWALAWRADNLERQAGWSLAAGFAAGLAALMRPSWLLFVPFAAVIGFAVSAERGKQALVSGVMLVGLCLTMSPWWLHNYLVAGRFVPTTLQVGASLYDGLNPAATGASDMRFVPKFIAEQRAADAAAPPDPSELFDDRLDRRLRDAAIAWARQSPGRVVQLAATKFARMWNLLPNAGEFQSQTLRLVLAVTYGPVMLLAVYGTWRFARRDWPGLLCVLPAVYFTCLHVVFVSSIRYRQPAMLPLIVLAAGVLTPWVLKGSTRPSPSPTPDP